MPLVCLRCACVGDDGGPVGRSARYYGLVATVALNSDLTDTGGVPRTTSSLAALDHRIFPWLSGKLHFNHLLRVDDTQ